MDFDFTEEQQMLRQMTRELLSAEATPAAVRTLAESAEGFSQATWERLAELGLLGLAIPESLGGQGLGMVEQALVLEEMGRAALPAPYFSTAVLAAGALAAGSGDLCRESLKKIAAGSLKASLALMEESLGWSMEAVRLPAREDGDGWVLDGVKWLVPWALSADLILVAARTSGGITLFALDRSCPGLTVEPLDTIDLTNRVGKVTLRNVRADRSRIVGEVDGGAAILDRVLQHAAVGASAEMLGASRKCMEMAVEYAKTREQFGQPIGTFQAIKHKCADMLMEVEESHSIVYYAAWALSAGAPDAAFAASAAKAYVSDASRKVCSDAIQVHGGIGFTWDYDLHLYFKRAKHLEPLYGNAPFHRERVLQLAVEQLQREPKAEAVAAAARG